MIDNGPRRTDGSETSSVIMNEIANGIQNSGTVLSALPLRIQQMKVKRRYKTVIIAYRNGNK